MKILIADTYYPAYLKEFASGHPELNRLEYAERHGALMAAHFAEADCYSHFLGQLGHEASEIVLNADFLQHQWAREHGTRGRSLHAIFVEQVRLEKPDVLYMQNMSWLDDYELSALREHARVIVGQIASPLPAGRDLSGFDLILSSFPHFVRFFRNGGIPSEYLRLAFDSRLLSDSSISSITPTVPIAFVGGLSRAHQDGTELLEKIAGELPLSIWGYGVETLSPASPLRALHRGPAWATDMYRVLAGSRIALNRHIDVAGPFANNLRLFEATGVGTCLVTDARDNLAELFEPDREVATYTSHEECVERCRYLLDNESERRAIAEAGQRRTLAEHTYEQRMPELAAILERHLREPGAGARHPVRAAVPPLKARATATLREVAVKLPAQRALRSLYRRLSRRGAGEQEIFLGYRVISRSDVSPALTNGWKAPEVAAGQRNLVNLQLRQMYQGDVPSLFRVAADAVQATGVPHGKIVEVGCASGYYYEVLSHLLRRQIDYVGVDYSHPLLEMARRCYPDRPFVLGDATALPVAGGSCDILFSDAAISQVPDYAAAISESARVTRRWCIFHRTPVSPGEGTTCFEKEAYGASMMELTFGEKELVALFEQFGLRVERAIVLDQSTMRETGGRVSKITYVCRKC